MEAIIWIWIFLYLLAKKVLVLAKMKVLGEIVFFFNGGAPNKALILFMNYYVAEGISCHPRRERAIIQAGAFLPTSAGSHCTCAF